MALITTGLPNGGRTTHYNFSYDDSFAQSPTNPAGPEPARTIAVMASCENDYNWLANLFGRSDVTGINVQVNVRANVPATCVQPGFFGACWNGSITQATIQLLADQPGYSNNPAYLRYLLILEGSEIFMMAQNTGWFQGSNEGSKGEGLSRFLSGEFLAQNGFLGIGILNNLGVADKWLNSPRQDFVNTAPDDNGFNATNAFHLLSVP
jgi:hypothetical protein